MTKKRTFEGAIFDMDGVITQTAKLHAKAWKTMFDGFLKDLQGHGFQPFDIREDYLRYIDGKPRLDGIRSFLQSRNISLREGDPADSTAADTVHGLGNIKNGVFLQLLEKEGAKTYPDALQLIQQWKGKTELAVISASKNCRHILESAEAINYFGVLVDGIFAEQKQLNGKPDPDIFLEASRQMGLDPAQCIIFEDAIAGVEAGKKGGFGLVVGVARDGGEKALLENGADFVVKSLKEVEDKIKDYA